MSYILDALKKLETEKERKARGTGMVNIAGELFKNSPAPPKAYRNWPLILGLVLLASFLTFGATFLFLHEDKGKKHGISERPAPPPAVSTLSPPLLISPSPVTKPPAAAAPKHAAPLPAQAPQAGKRRQAGQGAEGRQGAKGRQGAIRPQAAPGCQACTTCRGHGSLRESPRGTGKARFRLPCSCSRRYQGVWHCLAGPWRCIPGGGERFSHAGGR